MAGNNFKQSLRLGDIGASIWLQAQKGEYKALGGTGPDFESTKGDLVELKTDMYKMHDTPNFFFERYSDSVKKSPGGPWQALQKGSNKFIYFYLHDSTYFVFDTAELVGALDKILPGLAPTSVGNNGWQTSGYRVPRNMVDFLADKYIIGMRAKKL